MKEKEEEEKEGEKRREDEEEERRRWSLPLIDIKRLCSSLRAVRSLP